MPYCLDYCNFKVLSQVASVFPLLSSISYCVGYSGSLLLHVNLKILVDIHKIIAGILIGIAVSPGV